VFKLLPSLTSTLFCSWDCENEQRRADFAVENIQVHQYIISGTIKCSLLLPFRIVVSYTVVMESCMDKLSVTYKQSIVLQTRIICAKNVSVWFLRVSQNRPLHQNVVTRPVEQNFHFGLQLLPTLQLWVLSLDFQLWSIFQNTRLRSSKRTLVFSFILIIQELIWIGPPFRLRSSSMQNRAYINHDGRKHESSPKIYGGWSLHQSIML
jgi:hypothetical protein